MPLINKDTRPNPVSSIICSCYSSPLISFHWDIVDMQGGTHFENALQNGSPARENFLPLPTLLPL